MEESMKDYEDLLEASYSLMGDGVHDTDTLLACGHALRRRCLKPRKIGLQRCHSGADKKQAPVAFGDQQSHVF